MSHLRCYRAAALLTGADEWLPDAALLVDGERIARVLSAQQLAEARASLDVEWIDLGEVTLAPGFVNAHAHLELGELAGSCPASEGLLPWIGAVLQQTASMKPADFARGVQRGARRLLETGTTSVGDIDSSGASLAGLAATGLRARVYREVLDAGDATRRAAALQRLEQAPVAGDLRRVLPGVSPHAPHTVSRELLQAATEHAVAEGSALSVHLAETAEEVEWLASGAGPFARVLGESPHAAGWELLEAGGVARTAFSLVHANHITAQELARVVSLGGVLVHCPGTHAFFDRAGAPLDAWLAAGAIVALGTDSHASNEDLDLRRELALAARAHPGVSTRELYRMATEGGAAALGLQGEVGVLGAGAYADFIALELPASGPGEALDTIVKRCPSPVGVWIGGRAL